MNAQQKLLALTLALFGACGNANATLVNPGFEAGSLSGWSTVIPPGGSIAATTFSFGQTAIEGRWFADLKTDGPGSFTTLSQPLGFLGVGSTLMGWASFWDEEEANGYDSLFNDNAQVELLNSINAVVATPWSFSHAANVGSGITLSQWTQFNWTALAADTYTLQMKITNAVDSDYDSHAFLDGVKLTAVPEPASLALFGLGLLSLGFARRKAA